MLLQIIFVMWFIVIYFRMKQYENMASTCRNMCEENFAKLKRNGGMGQGVEPSDTPTRDNKANK
jgi:hypothetical protein